MKKKEARSLDEVLDLSPAQPAQPGREQPAGDPRRAGLDGLRLAANPELLKPTPIAAASSPSS